MAAGQLLRAELNTLAVADGRLYRAELDSLDIADGRLYRAELDSVVVAAGRLLRAEIDSTAFADGRLYRAELDSVNAPVNAGGIVNHIEPWSTVTLQGTGGNSPPTTQTWVQTSGPAVTLSGSGDSRTYTAPSVIGGVTLIFVYTVDGQSAETSHVIDGPTETDLKALVRRPVQPH
ncbi:hypothetical protein ACFRFH_12200 [Leifsonia sp. NPDC056824]|uniref:hypothetical protein n=1 Tax=Leifsonia sp. NPDC056824 TaxID=3345953 RepID=UPI0036BFF5ED